MKKKELYLGLTCLCAGIALILLAQHMDLHGGVFGMAGVCLGWAVQKLYHYLHWSKEENREEYFRREKENEIQKNDERNVMLRNKMGSIAFEATMTIQFVLWIAVWVCNSFNLFQPYTQYGFYALAAILLAEFIIYLFAGLHVSKKY